MGDSFESLASLGDIESMSDEFSSDECIDKSKSNKSSMKIPQNILQMQQNSPKIPQNIPQMPQYIPQMPQNPPQINMLQNLPQNQNYPINYNNLHNKCPTANNPLIIPILLPPLPPLQKGGKKIYPLLKNQQAGHFYNASIPYQINYPGYEYLQKYMNHYTALKNQEINQKN